MALDPFKTSSAIGSQLNDAAVDPFDNGSALRGGLNQTSVGLASSLFARPAQVGVFPEPRFAKGGLVKRVVQQQMHEQRRKLPMFQEPAPEYKAEGGPVEEPRPTTMAEDTVDAKLNPDEYVIPAEVVRKKGTEFFDNLVQNVQGKRKGIVPVMQGGKMYAATGGDPRKAIEEATGIAKKANYIPMSAAEAAGQKTPIQEYTDFTNSVKKPQSAVASATQKTVENLTGVNSKAGVVPMSAAEAAGQKTPIQEYTDFTNSVKKPPQAPTAVQNAINTSVGVGPKTGYVPLSAKGADAELFTSLRKPPSGIMGGVNRLFNKLPEYELARGLVASPKYQEGLVEAAQNIQKLFPDKTSTFAGKTLPGQNAAVDAQDLGVAVTAQPTAQPALPKANTSAKKGTDLGAIAAPVSAVQPAGQDASSVSPKIQAQDTSKYLSVPSGGGGTATIITPEYNAELNKNAPKVTPEQQAVRDAESEKVLAGILNVPKDAFSTAKFDPVEQYKQKLAADLAYKQKVADMQELQYRNYGTVFPGENTYGNVDNSVTTKQMELDAAGRTTPQEQFKNELELAKLQMEREKAGRNKYRPVPQLDGSVNMVAVEGPEADAMVQAQQARQRKQELMRKSLLAQNDDSATDEQKSAAKEILRRLAIEGIYDPDKSE